MFALKCIACLLSLCYINAMTNNTTNEQTYKVPVKRTITGEQIDNIMDSAMRGITYWADAAMLPDNIEVPEGMDYTSQALTRGLKLRIHDAEGEKWYTLTMAKFLKGLAMHDRSNYDDYDQLDADMVVQYALFGELIYG